MEPSSSELLSAGQSGMLAPCTPRPLLISFNTMYLHHATHTTYCSFSLFVKVEMLLHKKKENKTKNKPIILSDKSVALLMRAHDSELKYISANGSICPKLRSIPRPVRIQPILGQHNSGSILRCVFF